MTLWCKMTGHLPPPGKPVWNDGFFFGTCPRCGAEIIRRGADARWTDVPPGYRVAWRERTDSDVRW